MTPPPADNASRDEVLATTRRLEDAVADLRRLDASRLARAWEDAVEETASRFRPGAGDGDGLRGRLARTSGLSPEGLDAGMAAILDGVRTPAALALLRTDVRAADRRPGLAILPSNLPGLAVQTLLPALAVRRPLLLKSSRGEAVFAPAFVGTLARREPVLGRALAALTWRGGDREIEDAVLPRMGRVVAYGDDGTMASLDERLDGDGSQKLVPRGARISLAVMDHDAIDADLLRGLAEDVALFDQRGCLSPHALLVLGADGTRAREIADRLAGELAELANRWPPGRAGDEGALAAVRSLRDEAVMRGLHLGRPLGGLRDGTVRVEAPGNGRPIEPSPGLRTLTVHPLPDAGAVRRVLRPWRDRVQGAAVAGDAAGSVAAFLRRLGVTHIAPPGELQRPDLGTWANGGVEPLDLFA